MAEEASRRRDSVLLSEFICFLVFINYHLLLLMERMFVTNTDLQNAAGYYKSGYNVTTGTQDLRTQLDDHFDYLIKIHNWMNYITVAANMLDTVLMFFNFELHHHEPAIIIKLALLSLSVYMSASQQELDSILYKIWLMAHFWIAVWEIVAKSKVLKFQFVRRVQKGFDLLIEEAAGANGRSGELGDPKKEEKPAEADIEKPDTNQPKLSQALVDAEEGKSRLQPVMISDEKPQPDPEFYPEPMDWRNATGDTEKPTVAKNDEEETAKHHNGAVQDSTDCTQNQPQPKAPEQPIDIAHQPQSIPSSSASQKKGKNKKARETHSELKDVSRNSGKSVKQAASAESAKAKKKGLSSLVVEGFNSLVRHRKMPPVLPQNAKQQQK